MRARPSKASNGHTNGHANGHGPPLGLTSHDLTHDISQAKRQINALATERAELALPSLQGDEGARQRIVDIDFERANLVSSLETLEAALRQVQQDQRSTGWRVHLPRLVGVFRYNMANIYDGPTARHLRQLMLDRTSAGYDDIKRALEHIEEAPERTAKRVADELLPPVITSYSTNDQQGMSRALTDRQQLTDKRNALVKEAAQEILAQAGDIQIPAELNQAMKEARERLAVEPDPLQGVPLSERAHMLRPKR